MSTSNLTFQVTTALLPYSRVYQMYIKPTSPSDQYDQHVAHPQKYYPKFLMKFFNGIEATIFHMSKTAKD